MKVKIAGVDVVEAAAPDIYDEIRASSITPNTFEFREYEADLNDPVYTERYRDPSTTASVIRFGINTDVIPVVAVGGAGVSSAVSTSGKSGSSKSDKSDFVFT